MFIGQIDTIVASKRRTVRNFNTQKQLVRVYQTGWCTKADLQQSLLNPTFSGWSFLTAVQEAVCSECLSFRHFTVRCWISSFRLLPHSRKDLGSKPTAFLCRFACSSHAYVDFLRVLQFPSTSKDMRVEDMLLTLHFTKVLVLHQELFIQHLNVD